MFEVLTTFFLSSLQHFYTQRYVVEDSCVSPIASPLHAVHKYALEYEG
jgi:hypothetical protein